MVVSQFKAEFIRSPRRGARKRFLFLFFFFFSFPWSKELRQRPTEINKVDRLGDIVVEASINALFLHIRHDIGRERNDGQLRA